MQPNPTDDLSRRKAALRERILALRRACDEVSTRAASSSIAERVFTLSLWRDVRVVHTYIGAMPGEVRTDRLISECFATGRTVIVPIVRKGHRALGHVTLDSLDSLIGTRWGGLEPADGEAIDPAKADIVIVPGVAFDRDGNRLGMGGGYYDRFLKGMRCSKVAVAQAFQIVESVPCGQTDVPVDLIVTPDETIRVGH